MRAIALALVAVLAASSSSAQSVDEVIALKRTTGTTAISADGRCALAGILGGGSPSAGGEHPAAGSVAPERGAARTG